MTITNKFALPLSITLLLAGIQPALAALTVEMAEKLPAAIEGENYNSPLVVNHNSREPVTFDLVNGPRGLRISNGGRVSWQPDYDVAGSHNIVFTVSNAESSTTVQTTLDVKNTNRPPKFTSYPLSGTAEGLTYRYNFNAVDPDDDKLEIKVAKKPAGMTASDSSLSWDTGYNDAGAYDIELIASDGEVSVRQSFTLAVQNTNRVPVISNIGTDKVALEENSKWSLAIEASDPDGEDITLTLDGAPGGMTLSGNTISWQPGFEQSGSYNITINASDGENTSSVNLAIEVKDVNRLPHFISQSDTELTETDLYQYEIRAFDADQSFLQYKLLEGPEEMQLSGSQLTWQTDYEDAGTHPVKIGVSDGTATITQEFELAVANKNRPPEFLSEPVTEIKESETFKYTINAVDPDGLPIVLNILKLPDQIKRNGNTLSWQTDFKSAGSYAIHIVAKDDQSKTDQLFTLEVENVNHKPVFESTPPTKAIEAIDYRYPLKASDADDEELAFSLQNPPEGMQIINDTVVWRPRFGQAGKHEITVAVTDSIDIVTQTFTVKVSDTNREPVLVNIEDQQVYAGDKFEYELQASDPEGDEVELELVRHPDGMRLKRGEISWRPKEEDIGGYTIIVSATDGDLTVRKHFVLEVLPEADD